MDRTEVRGTLRDMWETRPSRPREGRQIAGVAAALGGRYDIDPVLLRVGFAASAFYGVGILLYLLGWLLLPDGRDEHRRAPRPAALVAVGVLIVIGFTSTTADDVRGFVLPAIASIVLLFLLHRSRGGAAPRPEAPATGAVTTDPVTAGDDPPLPAPDRALPPAWDPLGAAPFAWDLPEPAPPPPPAPVRRAPVSGVTLAVALLAGAGVALVALWTGTLSPSTVPLLLGVVLAVLGAGLVIGSFLHTGHGLIPITVVVGVLTWAAVAAPLQDWPDGPVGEVREAPTTAAALAPVYSQSVGDLQLDLRGLDLSVPPGGDASALTTSVRLGAGDVEVLLPPDADVTVTGTVGLGEITVGTRHSSGVGAAITAEDLGADGVRSGRPVELTVAANLGDVTVRRG